MTQVQKPGQDQKKQEDEDGGNGNGGNGNGGGGTTPPPSDVGTALREAVVKAIAFLATGAGFLTFVAATGAAVTYARFWAAELPADQAVQLVPRNDLIALGALALLVFVVLAFVAVAGAYAIDPSGRATDAMRPGLSILVTAEVVIAIVLSDASDGTKWLGVGITVAIGAIGVAVTLIPVKRSDQRGVQAPPPPAAGGQAGFRKFAGLFQLTKDAEPVLPSTQELELAAKLEQAGKDEEADTLTRQLIERKRHPLTLPWVIAAGATAGALFGLFLVLFEQDFVGVSVLLASVLAAISFGVARASGDQFWPYGLAVFFSVILFGSVLMVARLIDAPKANPVALMRVDGRDVTPVVGLLIARADDRYWLGNVDRKCDATNGKLDEKDAAEGSGRIFSIPRDQVLDDVTGAQVRLKDINRRTKVLLNELVRRQPRRGYILPSGQGVEQGRNDRQTTVHVKARPQATVPAVTIPPPCATPRLTRLVPDNVAPGRRVRARGRYLGRVSSVAVGTETVTPLAATANSLTFRAPLRRGRHAVAVSAGDKRSNEVQLRVRRAGVIRLSARQLFASGRARLRTKATGRLEGLKRVLDRRQGRIQSIRVTGYADFVGQPPDNRRLSRRRAATVTRFLRRGNRLQGVLISSKGVGEDRAVARTLSDPRRERDRKVNVVVFYRE